MGLDMYLKRRKYVGANWEHRKVKGTIFITANDKEIPIDFNKVSYIEELVGDWRKANAIHKWFVNNVQYGEDDCKEYYVEIEQLEELLKICKKIKKIAVMKQGQREARIYENGEFITKMVDCEYIENADEIEKLLPTTDGFFFGSTDYDEWYMKDINYTIKMLTQVLKEEKEYNENGFYSDFYYTSSW